MKGLLVKILITVVIIGGIVHFTYNYLDDKEWTGLQIKYDQRYIERSCPDVKRSFYEECYRKDYLAFMQQYLSIDYVHMAFEQAQKILARDRYLQQTKFVTESYIVQQSLNEMEAVILYDQALDGCMQGTRFNQLLISWFVGSKEKTYLKYKLANQQRIKKMKNKLNDLIGEDHPQYLKFKSLQLTPLD
jgi:hypothetical protein